MSCVIRKPALYIFENKDAADVCGNRAADQRLCFLYVDSTIPLLLKFEISCLKPSCLAIQLGLCRTWSETPKIGFLKYSLYLDNFVVLEEFQLPALRQKLPRYYFLYTIRNVYANCVLQ